MQITDYAEIYWLKQMSFRPEVVRYSDFDTNDVRLVEDVPLFDMGLFFEAFLKQLASGVPYSNLNELPMRINIARYV